jgi:CubicO group peptidase (beta-lactamase class C family)
VLRYLKRWRPPASDPIEDPVTLRRLFGMTSGANVPGFPGYAVGTLLPDEIEVLRGVPPCNTPPIHVMRPPGTGRTYSGGGYQIAQVAIEDALGDQFVGLCSTLVLAPLGMERAGFFQPPDPASIDNFAEAHDDGGRRLDGGWHVYPELAAAGLWARPRDIVQVGAAMIAASRGETGPVMDPRGLAEVLTSVDGFGYGLGMALANADGHRAAFKRGSNLGYRCVFTAFPESGKAGAIMTNGEGGEAVVDKALVMIGRHFGWPAIGPMKE